MDIQQLHKKLQKEIKQHNSVADKLLIRHWNVFYNQLRKRPIERIEQKSQTILWNGLLQEIATLLSQESTDYDLDYSSNNQAYRWILNSSKLAKMIKEEV